MNLNLKLVKAILSKHAILFTCLVCTLSVGVSACKTEENKKETLQSLPFLAVDLNGNGKIDMIPLEESNVYFDVDGDGLAERTEWISPEDGIVGVYTLKDDSKGDTIQKRLLLFYTDGLKKLLSFDLNNDGQFDKTDRVTQKGLSYTRSGSFWVWVDQDQNGYPEKAEQKTFAEKCSIKSLNLQNTSKSNLKFSSFIECQDGKSFLYKEVDFLFEDSNKKIQYPPENRR